MFEFYVETRLAPTLQTGDVIILDNLSSTKAPRPPMPCVRSAHGFSSVVRGKRPIGAFSDPSNPDSPDLNPVEMAFAKLKALIRRAAARTYDDLWHAVEHVCDLFTDEECHNFFKAAGYEAD